MKPANASTRSCRSALAPATPSVKVCCRWRLKVTRLWCWWYAVLATSGQCYLVYRAISRCRSYNRADWRTEAASGGQSGSTDMRKPVAELYALIALTVFAVMTLPFFVVATCFRLGNLPADGVRLGFVRSAPYPRVSASTGSVWKYSAPLGVSLHLVASIFLLLPGVFLEAREIQHNLKSRAYLHKSEIDFAYPQYVPPGSNTSLADGIGTRVTPELVNYLLAACIYSVQYPSVFWYTSIAFSVLFSCLLVFIGAHSIIAFCGMSVVYKLKVNKVDYHSDYEPLLPELAVMLLYLAAETAIFVGAMALFNFGLRQFRLASVGAGAADVRVASDQAVSAEPPPLTTGYVPHTMAVTCLSVAALLRAPLFYDCVICYRITSGPALIGSAIADVVLLVTWVVVWLTITLKQKWSFRLRRCRCAADGSCKQRVTFESTTPAPRLTPTPKNAARPRSKRVESEAGVDSSPIRLEGGNGLFRLTSRDSPPRPLTDDLYRNELRNFCDSYYRSAFSPVARSPRSTSSADVYRTTTAAFTYDNRSRPLSTGYLTNVGMRTEPLVTFPEEPWQYDTTSLDSNDVLCSRV